MFFVPTWTCHLCLVLKNYQMNRPASMENGLESLSRSWDSVGRRLAGANRSLLALDADEEEEPLHRSATAADGTTQHGQGLTRSKLVHGYRPFLSGRPRSAKILCLTSMLSCIKFYGDGVGSDVISVDLPKIEGIGGNRPLRVGEIRRNPATIAMTKFLPTSSRVRSGFGGLPCPRSGRSDRPSMIGDCAFLDIFSHFTRKPQRCGFPFSNVPHTETTVLSVSSWVWCILLASPIAVEAGDIDCISIFFFISRFSVSITNHALGTKLTTCVVFLSLVLSVLSWVWRILLACPIVVEADDIDRIWSSINIPIGSHFSAGPSSSHSKLKKTPSEIEKGSYLERLGASVEKAMERFFTKWGTCKSST